ncbi:MAG: urocanate hydratase [Lewinellaceae bacterium]|nr:urocanate hydratase [Lewinellaceae bacterium]
MKNHHHHIFLKDFETLPEHSGLNKQVSHAPKRVITSLSHDDRILAVKNALRYFPAKFHDLLAQEFSDELDNYGRIYMYRFKPLETIAAKPIDEYPCKTKQAGAIMLMIQNNLDILVAKHPEELITYGGNGAVFQNWAQYHLTMKYLSEMTEKQTLVLYSGHPLGLFPSHKNAPRVVVTNGMMVPNYSKKEDWNKFNALGVTSYGQMTAGSFMYIGPQGIVHGTTLTLMNAGRILGFGTTDLRGKVFVTSGLGGMSGAQAKAAVITGAVGVIAEVDREAIQQRINDGYIQGVDVYEDLNKLVAKINQYRAELKPAALIYYGNIVDFWEKAVQSNLKIELGSDQTSLHNIDDMGYCPVGYTFEEAKQLLIDDKKAFQQAVKASLIRHVDAINTLAASGMYFWDYGNAFLKEAGEAGAKVWKDKKKKQFAYPSYVEDIMGPMCFDFGFGPFRWVCLSGDEEDLYKTDKIAAKVLKKLVQTSPSAIHSQLNDNLLWIESARENLPIVGSKSRILYADAEGRIKIALAFNKAIKNGKLKAGIVLGRDHHDVSGTDSPYRETANIYDGSQFTADMAVHNFVGDAFRGATWISLHNGGGVGWGEAINGGFGMYIDGSKKSKKKIKSMLYWDVNNGIARRSWARNPEAIFAIKRAMEDNADLNVTLPHIVDEALLSKHVK